MTKSCAWMSTSFEPAYQVFEHKTSYSLGSDVNTLTRGRHPIGIRRRRVFWTATRDASGAVVVMTGGTAHPRTLSGCVLSCSALSPASTPAPSQGRPIMAKLSCHYVPRQPIPVPSSQALQNSPTRPTRASWACDLGSPNVAYFERLGQYCLLGLCGNSKPQKRFRNG